MSKPPECSKYPPVTDDSLYTLADRSGVYRKVEQLDGIEGGLYRMELVLDEHYRKMNRPVYAQAWAYDLQYVELADLLANVAERSRQALAGLQEVFVGMTEVTQEASRQAAIFQEMMYKLKEGKVI